MFSMFNESIKNQTEIPAMLQPVFQVLLQNVVVPMAVENQEMQEMIRQQIEAAAQNQGQQQQQMQPAPSPDQQTEVNQQQPMPEEQQPVAA